VLDALWVPFVPKGDEGCGFGDQSVPLAQYLPALKISAWRGAFVSRVADSRIHSGEGTVQRIRDCSYDRGHRRVGGFRG